MEYKERVIPLGNGCIKKKPVGNRCNYFEQLLPASKIKKYYENLYKKQFENITEIDVFW